MTGLICGQQQVLTQNVIYALPPMRVLLFTDATTPTIEQSTTPTFTANVAVSLTNGQAELAGGYIQCTSGNINAFLKKIE